MRLLKGTASLLVAILFCCHLCAPGRAFSQDFFEKFLSDEKAVSTSQGVDPTAEEIRAEKKEIEKTLKDLSGESKEGETGEFLARKEDKLQEHLSLLERQESILGSVKQAEGKLASIENEVKNEVKELRKKYKENSFLTVSKLEEELLVASEQIENNRLLEESLRQLLKESKGEHQELEEKRRLIKEQLGSKAEEDSSLRNTLELVKLDSSVVQQKLRLRKMRLRKVAVLQAFLQKKKEILEKETRNTKKNIILNQESLKEIQADLDHQIKRIDQETLRAKKSFTQFRAQDFKDVAPLGVNLEELRFSFWQMEEESLLERSLLLKNVRNIWDFRSKFLNDQLSKQEILETLEEYRELSKKFEREADKFSKGLMVMVRGRMAFDLNLQERELSWKERRMLQAVAKFTSGTAHALVEYIREVRSAQHLLEIIEEEATPGLASTRPLVRVVGALWTSTKKIWVTELWSVDDSPITPGKLITAVVLFLFGIGISRIIAWKVGQRLLAKLGLASGIAVALQTMTYYLLIIFFCITALNVVYIPLTVFTLLGGALAIGVGFGSQNIVKDFFSGLIILFEQPVRVGDVIEFAGMRGTVSRIGTRSTLIVTPENLELVVPNSALVENNITNWTLANRRLRRNITIGVAHGSSTQEVSKALTIAVREQEEVLENPSPLVLFRDFGQSALIFEVRFWVVLKSYTEVLRIESNIRHRIDQLFRESGIIIPFPQQVVHLDLAAVKSVANLSEVLGDQPKKGKAFK